MDVLGRKIVFTRKPHICFGCGREFPKGANMERSCVVDGGVAWTCYLCQTCIDISSEMRYDDEFCYGDLREEALERENKI
jgi:hypothetical protein